jgi:hypothetical protein
MFCPSGLENQGCAVGQFAEPPAMPTRAGFPPGVTGPIEVQLVGEIKAETNRFHARAVF